MMRSCKCFPHVSKMSTLTYNQVSSAIINLKKGNLYCLAAQWKVALTRYLLKTTFWNLFQE
jgi:hypothetical protein